MTTTDGDTLSTPGQPPLQGEVPGRASRRPRFRKILLHGGFLLIAIVCLAAYEHLSVEGHSSASLACLAAAAVFGFAPLRDLLRIVLGLEGKVLHLVHALGSLGLFALPLSGVVSGAPVLTRAAMAPFAIMGAAQAVMHQDHPRSARQAAALERFASSLPEVAQFTSSGNLTSPANALRAVTVLSDILAKAQTLGETELEADPGFQNALSQVSTRFGANLALDAVDLAVGRLATNPATASAVPALRQQLAAARKTFAGAGSR